MLTIFRRATALALLVFAAGCSAGRSFEKEPDVSAAPESSGGPERPPILVAELTPPVGTQVRLLTVEYPPGGASPAHRHPGEIVAYVLEGEVETQLDDGPARRYGPGGSWHERPNQLHAVSRNTSAPRPAKLLVFYVSEPGVPVTKFGE